MKVAILTSGEDGVRLVGEYDLPVLPRIGEEFRDQREGGISGKVSTIIHEILQGEYAISMYVI